MYDPPAYVWVLTIGKPTAIAAATCIALYSGAVQEKADIAPGRCRHPGADQAFPFGGAASPAAPGPLPVGRRSPSPAETAERTSHAVYRNR